MAVFYGLGPICRIYRDDLNQNATSQSDVLQGGMTRVSLEFSRAFMCGMLGNVPPHGGVLAVQKSAQKVQNMSTVDRDSHLTVEVPL
jgi:hypothetical protein